MEIEGITIVDLWKAYVFPSTDEYVRDSLISY